MAEERNESSLERWDRNFSELLQELRVAQTGGQILFAFLLTLPFSARFFEETSPVQRGVYVFTLISAAISMAFMIAPVSYHRQVFRQGRKPELVRAASRMAQAGLFAMLLAVAGAVYFALDVAIDHWWASAMVAFVVTTYVLLWYVLPKIRR
ncbi:DUF6328 family protein [Allorhizocola rhizosphaerae]|uniref:DUF6328 family protein n=1 Tax=Allorhizocola rhizosphaerae TaxID=1872709 RepID=UPI000E3D35AF|nr:DUF6328 family protein [Allorhizocola rhizosphaerae]